MNCSLSEILHEEWEMKSLHCLKKQAKKYRKALKNRPDMQENRLIEKQLLWLESDRCSYSVHFCGENPLVGMAVLSLSEINDSNVIAVLTALSAHKYICSADVESLLYQGIFMLIKQAFDEPLLVSSSIAGIYAMLDLDFERITRAVNPLEIAFSKDKLYTTFTAETRAVYRAKASAVAEATGIPEDRLTFEYMTRAEKDKEHIGTIIFRDYRRVFPYVKVWAYLLLMLGIPAALTVLTMLITSWYGGIFSFILWIAGIKPIIDHRISRHVKGNMLLPRLELNGKIPEDAQTLCVLSALITSEKDIYSALDKLSLAKDRNNSDNLKFCLLADLKPSEEAENPEDKRLIKLIHELETDTIVIVRKREFSKTQKKYQGYERKRGAIEALVRFIKGEKSSWRYISCSEDLLKNTRFIVCLDYDTMPLMNTISELVAIVLHPLNEKYGIIAPRITTSLHSSLKTEFARIMSGGGGCSSISLYDNFSGEFYYDCFGEGIFTGKGLIRVDAFYDKVTGTFPVEKILSHDILEGGVVDVAFAGDVEFSDSFPSTSKAYFKRAHRWLRGDLQNVDFLHEKRFSALTRVKLWDNLRRVITPIFVLGVLFLGITSRNGWLLIWLAVHGVLIPYVMSFIPSFIDGITFSNTRQFYSPVLSRTRQLFTQALMEIILIPKNCAVALDAVFRTFWRRNFSKHNLLQWTTASAFDGNKKVHFAHMISAEILSLALLVWSVFFGNVYTGVLSLLCLTAMPVMLYCDRETNRSSQHISKKMREDCIELCRKMWQFYDDFVTHEHNFLPPDNVQFSPVFRVSPRTSPTNIGMYLLSCLCARQMDIISREEFSDRVTNTLDTIDKLEKWNAHLYNWYDTHTLNRLDGFVSTVDSGNLVCCLAALENALHEMNFDCLAKRCKALQNADFGKLYDFRRNLFFIGFDKDKNEFAKNHYDLLMSEARMTSYYAIAAGQVPEKHWRALSRTMSRSGHFAGPCAWTGTAFEYFMPEILLKSEEGSLGYEALRYAMHCQKRRGAEMQTPYGISESGYFAFDNQLNYQYKAHGVQKLGLKAGLDKEQVIAPYASFLMFPMDINGSWNNLARLEKMGAMNPRYGFYEALDCTESRVGGKSYGIVRSHMAHHVGMSICSAANALYGGILQNYFLNSDKMKRGTELLEEKIMTGEKILKIEEERGKIRQPNEKEEFNDALLSMPRINLLSNGSLTLLTADNGDITGYFDHKLTCMKTTDLLRRPKGMFFGLVEKGQAIPFFMHPLISSPLMEQQVCFTPDSTEYYTNRHGIVSGMKLSIHKDYNAEIREFAVENTTAEKRQLTLFSYIEPALANENDIKAHPAFMDLFLQTEYDRENGFFIVSRKERHSDRRTFMCIGFYEKCDYTYSFNREEVVEQNRSFSFINKAEERSSTGVSVPCPCVFIKTDMPLEAHSKRILHQFICYGNNREELIEACQRIRANNSPTDENMIISPLVRNTIAGRMAAQCLPNIIYGGHIFSDKNSGNELDRRGLWRYGISGDRPIIIFDCRKEISHINSAMQLEKGLASCQIKVDLIVLCTSTLQVAMAEKSRDEMGAECHIFEQNNLDDEMQKLIYTAASFVFSGSTALEIQELRQKTTQNFLPLIPCKEGAFEDSGFLDGAYAFSGAGHPWCNIIANSSFGTLVSQNSLGFTWAMNSRENKLTPWYNDITSDNTGEMLLLKRRGAYYNLISGAKTVYAPNCADYYGRVKHISTRVSVNVPVKGMAKIVSVVLENDSDKVLDMELCYYIEPCLAAFDEDRGFMKTHADMNGISIENPANTVYKGVLAMTCDHEICGVNFEKYSFWQGASDSGESTTDICGALRIKIKLPPKNKEYVKLILSYTLNKNEPYSMARAAENQPLTHEYSNKIKLNCRNKALAELINTWLPWQTIGGRLWARTGFYQNGGAYGFRDQLQDSTMALYLEPKLCKRQILRACASQFAEGDVLHWWHDLHGAKKGVRTRYSDDMLWLPYAVCEYVKRTGDRSILDIPVKFCDGDKLSDNQHELYIEVEKSDKATVYEHCRKALEKGFTEGNHGLILMGCGDWNDSYNNVGIKGKGESVWLSMFYVLVAKEFAETSKNYGDNGFAEVLEKRIEALTRAIDKNAWDGEYYLRAYFDNGGKMGGQNCGLCTIDLLPQAFAALADLPDKARVKSSLNSAYDQLCDIGNGIIKLFAPPFTEEFAINDPGYVMSYPEGVRENGGQYTHAAVWLAMAFLASGDKERGNQLFKLLNPAARNEKFKNEPYFMTADIYTNPAAFGRGGWSIYTGAAGWYYRLALEYILGVKITGNSIVISPQIILEADEKAMLTLEVFDTKLHISIANGEEKGMFCLGEKVEKIMTDGGEKRVDVLI